MSQPKNEQERLREKCEELVADQDEIETAAAPSEVIAMNLRAEIETALADADIWPDEVIPSRIIDVMEEMILHEREACALEVLAFKADMPERIDMIGYRTKIAARIRARGSS